MRNHLREPSYRVYLTGRRYLLAATLLALGGASVSAAERVGVQLVENLPDQIGLVYRPGEFSASTVTIDGSEYTQISLGRESAIKVKGAPELPKVCRSVIIPDDARMAVRVVASSFYDVPEVLIVPSKGILSRQVDPATVPYEFGPAYQMDAFYPGELATLDKPYILRDYRGVVVQVYPFQYNPVTRTLRVYTDLTVEVFDVGLSQVNVLDASGRHGEVSLAFDRLYARHFVNYDPGLRYVPLDETGDMLIICYDPWVPNVQPLADHKNARGIDTTIVPVSAVGETAAALKSYIQGVYASSNLAFVLLVGDGAEVDTPTASGGSADPTYALLAGTDHYPDVMVGRFSAENAAQVDTQVQRTIEYEQMPATAQTWFKRGVGIGSAQGAGIGDDGEADWQHIENIRTDLLGYGYTVVNQIYDPGATAGQVSAAVNAGRGIINYCGHGSRSSWSTTGFSISHVNALVNHNELPFIVSVACVNGQFDGYTCFAEAWLRATRDGEPTGAIGVYASSINQSWAPPMSAQDEITDLLVDEAYVSFGTLCFAGSCRMMDDYAAAGQAMFDTWHVFGDPSVRVGGTQPGVITGARSCLAHGLAGEFCLELEPGGVEPRQNGVLLLEFDVSEPAYSVEATVDCVERAYTGTAFVAAEGGTVRVEFDERLSDADCCTVTLTGDVVDSFSVRMLAGDIDRDGLVTTGDASIIKPHFAEAVAGGTIVYDYDCSGVVTTGDFSQVKPKFGRAAPACP